MKGIGKMGAGILDFYRKIDKKYKFSFLVTFVTGMLVHAYMFTNKLPNHDYIYNIHIDQFRWPASLGRFFLNVPSALTSYFPMPWVNGVVAIFFMALAGAFITSIYRLENPVAIIVTNALFITFPAFADTAGFMFLLSGLICGVMLGHIALWFILTNPVNEKVGMTGFIICFVLAMGCYQANLTVVMYGIMMNLILEIIRQETDNSTLLKKTLKYVIAGGVGFVLYTIIQKLVLIVFGLKKSSYMGMDSAGFMGVEKTVWVFKKSIIDFIEVFIGGNGDFTAYEILNMAFGLFLITGVIMAVVKKKVYKNPLQLIMLIVISLCCIHVAYIFAFASEEVQYRYIMLYCLVHLYIFLVVLADRELKGRFATLVLVLSLAISYNFALIDNIGYHNLEYCWEQTLTTAMAIKERMHATEGYEEDTPVVIEGTFESGGRSWLLDRIPELMVGVNDVNLTRNERFLRDLMRYDLGYRYVRAEDEQWEQIIETPEFKEMKLWPHRDSVRMIDGVLVVKLGE